MLCKWPQNENYRPLSFMLVLNTSYTEKCSGSIDLHDVILSINIHIYMCCAYLWQMEMLTNEHFYFKPLSSLWLRKEKKSWH